MASCINQETMITLLRTAGDKNIELADCGFTGVPFNFKELIDDLPNLGWLFNRDEVRRLLLNKHSFFRHKILMEYKMVYNINLDFVIILDGDIDQLLNEKQKTTRIVLINIDEVERQYVTASEIEDGDFLVDGVFRTKAESHEDAAVKYFNDRNFYGYEKRKISVYGSEFIGYIIEEEE